MHFPLFLKKDPHSLDCRDARALDTLELLRMGPMSLCQELGDTGFMTWLLQVIELVLAPPVLGCPEAGALHPMD